MSGNEKINYWLEVLSDHEESGKSLKRYCQEHDLSYQTALYWKRKICAEEPRDLEFIEVDSVLVNSSYAGSGVVLVTDQGLKIELEASFNVECLRQVVSVLGII